MLSIRLVLFFFIFWSGEYCFSSLDVNVNVLNIEEKEELKSFLHFLFAENEFGYTLLSEKPLSFCFLPTGAPHIATRDFVFKIYQRGSRNFIRAVTAWKKIVGFGLGGNYSLIIYEENKVPYFALFVNKRAFKEVIEANADVFKKYFSFGANAESLYEALYDKEFVFNQLFSKHLPFGIILGYGRHNAELFQRREDLFSFHPPLVLLEKKSMKNFCQKELIYLNKHLQPIFDKSSSLLQVYLINFSADPCSEETAVLKRRYKTAHRELTEILKKENWLEMLLSTSTLSKNSVQSPRPQIQQ